MQCNQICDWNDPSDGCVKPPAGFCPMSDVPEYQKPQTNADCIRAMSDEELAKQFAHTSICDQKYPECMNVGENCVECLLEWLKQPAGER